MARTSKKRPGADTSAIKVLAFVLRKITFEFCSHLHHLHLLTSDVHGILFTFGSVRPETECQMEATVNFRNYMPYMI